LEAVGSRWYSSLFPNKRATQPSDKMELSQHQRKMVLRSPVWKYFLRTNKLIATCNLCQMAVGYSNSTSNLMSHLSHHHPNNYFQIVAKKAPASQATIPSLGPPPFPKEKQERLFKKLAAFLLVGFHPLSMIEEPHFISFVNTLEPRLMFMSRKTFNLNIIDTMYSQAKDKVKSFFIITFTSFYSCQKNFSHWNLLQ